MVWVGGGDAFDTGVYRAPNPSFEEVERSEDGG